MTERAQLPALTPRAPARRVAASPLATALLLAVALAGLPVSAVAAAGGTILPPGDGPTRDPLVLAYLQAAVAHAPADLRLRLRLVREQFALGRFSEAEQTLAPALEGGGGAAARALGFDLALASCWASAPGTPARELARRKALARLGATVDGEASPERLTQLGASARALGDLRLAASIHQRLAGIDRARCAPWLSEAARDLLAAGTPGRAAESFAQARACEPDPGKALALGSQAMEAYRAANDAPAAARLLEELLALHPSDEGLLREAERISLESRSDLAARAYERLAVSDPTRCATWLEKAAAGHLALGDPARAAERYARAAACERDDRKAVALGQKALAAHLAADDGRAALALARQLVQRFPSDEGLLREAERIALAQGDPQGARRIGARLVGSGSGASDPEVLKRQIDLALGAGDPAGAFAAGQQLARVKADDPEVLKRLIDLALGAGDPAGALAAAQQLARLKSADAALQLRLAQLAAWADRPALALQYWLPLARRGQPAEAPAKALELARALGDAPVVVELLERQSSVAGPLGAEALAELARVLEREEGASRALAALRAEVGRHPESRVAWEQLVVAEERQGDPAGVIDARAGLARHFGDGLQGAVAKAEARWALGHPRQALVELEPWSSSGEADARYWRLAGELAWSQEDDVRALRAYRALWALGEVDPVAAERLLVLAREAGQGEEVARVAGEAWRRLKQPRLLFLAMDDAATRGAWADVRALADLTAADEAAFAKLPDYWLLRGRAEERQGRVAAAAACYQQALAADPSSGPARAALLWLHGGAHDRRALAVSLATWSGDSWNDPLLRPAYAAGLEELGYRREALAYYAHDTRENPDDLGRAARYAQARARSGDEAGDDVAPDLGGLLRAERKLPRVSALRADAGGEANGPLDTQRLHAVVDAEALGSAFELRAGSTALRWAGLSPLGGTTLWETLALLRADVPALGGVTELSGGVSARDDGTILRAGLAHDRQLAPLLQGRLEGALNEPGDESAALRLYGVRSRAGASLTLAGSAAYARGAASWRSWSGRDGGAIASGGLATLELGYTVRTRRPELRLRLTGSHLRTTLAAGAATSGEPAFSLGVRPLDVLPSRFTAAGLGLHADWARLGPVHLTGDLWVGGVGPPTRGSGRVELGLAVKPARDSELSLTAYLGNDRFAAEGVFGAGLLFTRLLDRSPNGN